MRISGCPAIVKALAKLPRLGFPHLTYLTHLTHLTPAAALILLLLAATSCRQHAVRTTPASAPHVSLPGKQSDGSILLPNQWSLRPVGRQVELGDFPVNIAVHPGGRFAAVMHSGYGTHEIRVVDVLAGSVSFRTNV